jgi:hypothetical protein
MLARLLKPLVMIASTFALGVAWTPLLHNTEQLRHYKLDGDRLEVITPWAPEPRLPGQPVTRTILLWQRVK